MRSSCQREDGREFSDLDHVNRQARGLMRSSCQREDGRDVSELDHVNSQARGLMRSSCQQKVGLEARCQPPFVNRLVCGLVCVRVAARRRAGGGLGPRPCYTVSLVGLQCVRMILSHSLDVMILI